jgi:scyllo-inositol 2-dehydrogenase (NAD+)
MAKLGVAVLGVGEMGLRHAQNLRRLVPQARLIAVADVAADRARKVADDLEIDNSFGKLEDLLDCKGVDAVVVATPDKFHPAAVSMVAAAGKDVFCEKPLALSMKDAHESIDAVARAGVRLQMGFMRRYDASYAAAMKRIEAGEIGEPVIFKSIGRDKDGPPLPSYNGNLNGMLFYTNSIHDFDLARWLVRDEVTEVHAYTTVAIRPEVAQFGDVVASLVNLKFGHGAIGNVESYAQALYGYDVRTEIVGSKGSILVGSYTKGAATFLTVNGSVRNTADYFLTAFSDAYVAEMQDFVDCMLSDREPRITGVDGLKALAMAVAAEESHKQGKAIPVASIATAVGH